MTRYHCTCKAESWRRALLPAPRPHMLSATELTSILSACICTPVAVKDASDETMQAAVERIVNSIFSVFVTIGSIPIIRCSARFVFLSRLFFSFAPPLLCSLLSFFSFFPFFFFFFFFFFKSSPQSRKQNKYTHESNIHTNAHACPFCRNAAQYVAEGLDRKFREHLRNKGHSLFADKHMDESGRYACK